ncbi:hypothetical protein BpHYR1_029478 [Brachionus plicatilis]|uniref:Uncharacterized protein n=1 Tax=Brachionus plicatilis TaxID=10195 RepID=A0A3M7S243_BRAPC|nr:hypothetical protein BpHYR1_029478 [Brachionus plicatilis]
MSIYKLCNFAVHGLFFGLIILQIDSDIDNSFNFKSIILKLDSYQSNATYNIDLQLIDLKIKTEKFKILLRYLFIS